VIIIPGGPGSVAAMANHALQTYLKATAESATVVASVCTGALPLAATGLLEGRRVSVHWAYARELELLGARYERARFTEDGKFITSAGVSAGIDMALHMAAKLAGQEISQRIQLGLEYDPQPPFGGIDWTQVGEKELTRQRRGGHGRAFNASSGAVGGASRPVAAAQVGAMSAQSQRLFTVRRADSNDGGAILACLAAAFAPYRNSYTPAGFADTVLDSQSIEHRLSEMCVFVAVSEGDVVGTIACAATGDEGHLRGMAVLPDWQGTGVASALLEAAEAEIRNQCRKRITLNTTEPLARAMSFYEHHGFTRSGRVSDFFSMPLYEWVKRL